MFIVTAKHGQSPINPVKTNKPGHFADLVASLPDGKTNPAAIAITSASGCATSACGFVNDDDIALIWLADQTMGQQVTDYLNTNALPLFIDEVMGGDELLLRFGDPLKDSRTPDIIVRPNYGTIYTGSTAKNAEHGGHNYSDTDVGLLVSIPGLQAKTIESPVTTGQVAPTHPAGLGTRSPGSQVGSRGEDSPAARPWGWRESVIANCFNALYTILAQQAYQWINVADLPAGANAAKLTDLHLQPESRAPCVQAVGKASVLNHSSGPLKLLPIEIPK